MCYDAGVNIGRRIASARIELGLSQEEFAERIGVNMYTLRAWEQGRHAPKYDALMKIAEKTSKPLEWLIVGSADKPELVDADMAGLLAQSRRIQQQIEQQAALQSKRDVGGMVTLPYLGDVPAGPFSEALERTDSVAAVAEDMIEGPYRNDGLFVLRVVGDSMAGCGILPGMRVVVSPRKGDFDFGDIIVARLNGDVTLKRYTYHVDLGPVLMPENGAYAPIPLQDAMEVVGVVVAWYGKKGM